MGIMSWYATSHPGQVSLLSSSRWENSTGKNASMLCSWEVNASDVHSTCALNVCVAGTTVTSLICTKSESLEKNVTHKALYNFFYFDLVTVDRSSFTTNHAIFVSSKKTSNSSITHSFT